jgi:GH25 family lysozyme M1 (1,4-beta-N-acetylmuramidase)
MKQWIASRLHRARNTARRAARRNGQALAVVALVAALAVVGQTSGVLAAAFSQNSQVLAVQPVATAHSETLKQKKDKTISCLPGVRQPSANESDEAQIVEIGEIGEMPDADVADEEASGGDALAQEPLGSEVAAPETDNEAETANTPVLQPATPALEAEDQERPTLADRFVGNEPDETNGTEEDAADSEEMDEVEVTGDGMVLLTPEILEATGFDADALEAAGVDTDALAAAGVDLDTLPDAMQQALAESGADENCLAWLLKILFDIDWNWGKYSGWRTVNGKTYYYAQDTNEPVTGVQNIDGKLYYFGTDGAQQDVTFGVDVSRYQKSLDWQKLKKAGVEFAIVRIGYRGYGSGTLVLDSMYETHMNEAKAAGLRTGIYFFSQAINEAEAIEEAEACLYVLDYFGHTVDYPIYFDSEYANASHSGRADNLSVEERTACAVAFCETIENAGYKAGVYASTNWFKGKLDLSALSKYSIWNAHYSVSTSPLACDIWQSTGTGTIDGVSGEIDINVSYIG